MACIYNHLDGGCNDMMMIEKMTMAISVQWFIMIKKMQVPTSKEKKFFLLSFKRVRGKFTIRVRNWTKAVTHLCSSSSTEQKETQEKQVTDGSRGQMYANYKSQTFVTYNNNLYANPSVLGLYVKMSASLRINAYDFLPYYHNISVMRSKIRIQQFVFPELPTNDVTRWNQHHICTWLSIFSDSIILPNSHDSDQPFPSRVCPCQVII